MTPAEPHTIAVVGVGPRGTYALERLAAILEATPDPPRLRVHLVEPNELGPGVVYSTSQPNTFLMNTIAAQITAFSDSSVENAGPSTDGPTLREWLHDQGRRVPPGYYPARAEHGAYLLECVRASVARLRHFGEVIEHKSPAIDLSLVRDTCELRLRDGETVRAKHVLLTLGNVSHIRPTEPMFDGATHERFTGGGEFIDDPFPLHQKFEHIPASTSVGIIGLGLTAIDVILAMTVQRGGSFQHTPRGFTYRPSGREPKLFAWSRSGLPLGVRGRNQKGVYGQYRARFTTTDGIDALRFRHGRLDFHEHVLPLVLADMKFAFYSAAGLLPRSARGWNAPYEFRAFERGLKRHQRFSWTWFQRPLGVARTGYAHRLERFLVSDLRDAVGGNVRNPRKAACDVLRDIRDAIRYAVEFQSLTARSHKRFAEEFLPLYNRLAVGPPLVRGMQLLALMRAGILDIGLGPSPVVQTTGAKRPFVVRSSQIDPAREEPLEYIIDARVKPIPSELTVNLILRNLASEAIVADTTDVYRLGTLQITKDGYLVDGNNRPLYAISVMGQVCEGTVWYTQVAARPGVNSRAMRDAGRWASSVVRECKQLPTQEETKC